MNARAKAAREGRSFVRVYALGEYAVSVFAREGLRKGMTGRLTTVGVCPACWNIPARRKALLAQLAQRGLVVVHGEDGMTGRFLPGKAHAPNCPWSLAGRWRNEP